MAVAAEMPVAAVELLEALEPAALAAVRAAALACQAHVGRGDAAAADAAATDAMRASLATAPGVGTVVIGEGEKDDAPMLFNGERVGTALGPAFDVAVDPLECTSLCAEGLAGALTTIAFAPAGTLWSPGPAHYMDKLVVQSEARDAIDLRDEPEVNLLRIAHALGRRVGDLRVLVLDKPRHQELIERLRATGARVATPSGGDVAGALLAALPGSGVDVLMGVGGTPEGVLAACAVRALGGAMQGRLAPQRSEEAERIEAAGLDVTQVLTAEDLAAEPALFAATGVTGGELLRAPWTDGAMTFTESILIRPGSVRRIVESTPTTKES
ncbi:MAG: fructose,6-bisphosphatase [Solirubrobacteraceae bacterium]|nr:fructose,6-bisphosphatase [Solirubrobacteraceae bacterium]